MIRNESGKIKILEFCLGRYLNEKTILLLENFVLFKMRDKSEHSESEFYYPDKLSETELHQFQLTPKAKKKKTKQK